MLNTWENELRYFQNHIPVSTEKHTGCSQFKTEKRFWKVETFCKNPNWEPDLDYLKGEKV